jgi:hypothetical protein
MLSYMIIDLSPVQSIKSGHSANQNSFKSFAIATGPEKCFFTSSAQDE